MPRPRPVSPLVLETCADTLSDIDEDGILASDDELDGTSRRAKQRKIESIAESYERGAPIFILSASLRGPFEHKWKNPWKKDRRRGNQRENTPGKRKSGLDAENAPAIEETNLRATKHRKDLSDGSRSKSTDVFTSVAKSSVGTIHQRMERSHGSRHKSSNDRELSLEPTDEKHVVLSRDDSVAVEDQTLAAPGTADWLKKDGRRLNFGKINPPSSPTPRASSRQAKNKSRSESRDIGKQPSGLRRKTRSPETPKLQEKPHIDSAALPPSSSIISTSSRAHHRESENPEHRVHKVSPQVNSDVAPSFRVVSSTSQLPRFHYRQWNAHDSSPPNMSNHLVDIPPDEGPSTSTVQDLDGDIALPDGPLPQKDILGAASPSKYSPDVPLKAIQPTNKVAESTDTKTFEQNSTEQNTYDQIQSAQHVPAAPGVSSRIISLHSTAVHKENNNDSGSYDTQLSTQAALLHAQKSFQEDLASPEPDYDLASDQNDGIGEESLLAHETPFLDPATSGRAMPSNFQNWDSAKAQAMSTQCMIDAVTPFTFSTGKKPKPFRDLSMEPDENSPVAATTGIAFSPSKHSPSSVRGFHAAPTEDDQQIAGQQDLELAPAQRSTTQNSALPFALTGSTSNTVPDGQGGVPRAESFNLSQAIADAGSWLKQSFDFMNDTNHPPPPVKATSSAE